MELTWLMTLEDFCATHKTIRLPQYYEDFYRLGKTHLTGYHYLVYLDEDLQVINPYTKKDEGKSVLKSFISTFSREDALSQAHSFIIGYARENHLLE